jgi:hypothetical protein
MGSWVFRSDVIFGLSEWRQWLHICGFGDVCVASDWVVFSRIFVHVVAGVVCLHVDPSRDFRKSPARDTRVSLHVKFSCCRILNIIGMFRYFSGPWTLRYRSSWTFLRLSSRCYMRRTDGRTDGARPVSTCLQLAANDVKTINRFGKVYTAEDTDIQEVFTPCHVRLCCTNATRDCCCVYFQVIVAQQYV